MLWIRITLRYVGKLDGWGNFSYMLYALAYPKISKFDQGFIRGFRKQHDQKNVNVVDFHFTTVFGITDITEIDYIEHLKAIVPQIPQIDFCLRYAMLGKDDFSKDFYVFLVPDEGYSALSLLHDKLYTGLFEDSLKLEIPYIPHITIAMGKDPQKMKLLRDEINANIININGTIDEITVSRYTDNVINNIEKVALAK